jgi:hypothetical protein
MPFTDESISKIALHCAYEMFENDADINLKIFYFTNEKEMKQKPEDWVYVKFAACFAKEC